MIFILYNTSVDNFNVFVFQGYTLINIIVFVSQLKEKMHISPLDY